MLYTILVFFSFFIYSPKVISKNLGSTTSLLSKINAKMRQYPQLFCGIYVKPSWTQFEININGDITFPAASLIKIPIAVVLLQEIDKGKISFDEKLTLLNKHKVSGTGSLKNAKTGTKISLRQAFERMLTISDNTATNMIIDFLGGPKSCNEKISKLGLKNTALIEPIGSFSKSQNKISPKDLVALFEKSLEGDFLSNDSRKYLKRTLTKVKNKALIKQGIGKFTSFPHKTGTVGTCVGDAGIVYLPFQKRIGISIIVKRPWNDLSGQKFIKEISKIIYSDLKFSSI